MVESNVEVALNVCRTLTSLMSEATPPTVSEAPIQRDRDDERPFLVPMHLRSLRVAPFGTEGTIRCVRAS